MNITQIKAQGQVYTPQHMVQKMLDWTNYKGTYILQKHFMDNSCGEGAFLVEAVTKYIHAAKAEKLSNKVIKNQLQRYIHGIEKDKVAFNQCIHNLNKVAETFGLNDINWDIQLQDALISTVYNGKMDFVIGNPPYVKLHNLQKKINNYQLAKNGISDLFLAFFELGFNMLNKRGQLCYITPVSWIYSKAGKELRQYIAAHQSLVEIIDFQFYQVFPHVKTYSIVSRFIEGQTNTNVQYNQFSETQYDKIPLTKNPLKDIFINGRFYFETKQDLKLVRDIFSIPTPPYCRVKNGFATLANNIFFNDNIPVSPITIPVFKPSVGDWTKGIYPYHKDGSPMTEDEIKQCTDIYNYLSEHKTVLMKRDARDTPWYLYGRTQAIPDMQSHRLAVPILIKGQNHLDVTPIAPGEGVYNGLYIIWTEEVEQKEIMSILQSDELNHFIHMHRVYKNNGYYELKGWMVEYYLNYKLYQNRNYKQNI